MAQDLDRGLWGEFVRGYRMHILLHCHGGLRARLIRLFLVIVFVLAVGFFADLFGLGSLTERFTFRTYSLLVAPFHDTTERDNVPVVMIDDRDLRAHGWLWPVSYRNHARVLDEILKYSPRSVYMDFLFIDQRDDPTIGQLVPVLEKYLDAEIPVYLPVLPFKRQRSEFQDLTRTVLATRRHEGLDDEEYVLHKAARASPAYALYLHGCSRGDCGKSGLGPLSEDPDKNAGQDPVKDPRFSKPLQIQWGLVPSAMNGFLEGCKYSSEQSTCSVVRNLWFTTIFRGAANAEEQCPYMPVISVTNLLHEGFSSDASAFAEKALTDRISGKDVIYGQALVGVSDFVDPPTQPRVSSGYRHAMALENLRSNGDRYLKAETDISLPFLPKHAGGVMTVTPGTVFLWVLILLSAIHAFASFSTMRFLQKESRTLHRHLLVTLAANSFYLCLLLIIAVVQVWLFRLAPLNLAGLYGLIAAVRGASGSFYFQAAERGLCRFLRVPVSVPQDQQIEGKST